MVKKIDVDPAAEIYEVAQQDIRTELEKVKEEAEAEKKDSYAEGALDAFQFTRANSELQEYAILFKVKKEKEYKKAGKSWKQFCDNKGLNVRNVDRILNDISPLIKAVSDKMSVLSGVNFSKIRYLGRSVSDNLSEIDQNGIIIDGETIPISAEYKDDIEAYIDSLKTSEKQTRKETSEEIKAKNRVIKSLHQTIATQDNDLTRYTNQAKPGELSDAEKDQLKDIKDLKGQFDVFSKGMDISVNIYLYGASEKVKAEYFASLMYARQMIEAVWNDTVQEIGISALPGSGGDDWQPSEYQPGTELTE